jgi:hypothetical protein
MMEYDKNAAYALAGAQSSNVALDRPYLTRIGELADEAAKTGDMIEQFIGRCRGGGAGDETSRLSAPMPTGHLAQLDRLSQNLARVTQLACELNAIG